MAVLPVLSFLLCTGCQKNPDQYPVPSSPEPTASAKTTAIDKTDHFIPYSVVELGQEQIDTIHIDRNTFPEEAEMYLAFAEECLKEQGINSEIGDMYWVSLGLASELYSYDPIAIFTADSSRNNDPIYMVLMHGSEQNQKRYVGSFRPSEAVGGYRQKCRDMMTEYIDKLAMGMGLYANDGFRHSIGFDINRLRGYQILDVPKEISDCYWEAEERLHRYSLATWRREGQTDLDSRGYYTIQYDYIRSFKDVENWLGEYFSDELASSIVERNKGPYLEEDGVLKALDVGIGGPLDLEEYTPVKIAKIADDHYYLIVEAKYYDYDEDSWGVYDENTERYYLYFLFELKQNNKGWLFTEYTDIQFGSLYEF